MRNIMLIAAALLLALSGQAMAKDISFVFALPQDQFKLLSREAGSAIAFRNIAPTTPLGVTGFDAGIEVTAIDIKKESSYWKSAFNQDAPSYLTIPHLRLRKGLPFGIDVGAMYAYVPDSNIKIYGAELSKSIIDGGVATPSLGVRATYSKLAGVSDLDLQTVGLDASVSKGFVILTPYVGAGMLWINSKPKGALADGTLPGGFALTDEKIWQPRFFGGLKFSPLPLFGITAEVDYSERPAYSLKAALNF